MNVGSVQGPGAFQSSRGVSAEDGLTRMAGRDVVEELSSTLKSNSYTTVGPHTFANSLDHVTFKGLR